jgi:hypothetical protein
MPMQLRYPNLVTLGGVELTDEGRQPLQEERDERSVTVDLASGKKRKFIKGVRKSWNISWEMVPMHDGLTIDGCGGRNEIRSLAQGGAPLSFTIQDSYNVTENYTVFITDYSETVQFRRGEGSRYQISLGLEEQG